MARQYSATSVFSLAVLADGVTPRWAVRAEPLAVAAHPAVIWGLALMVARRPPSTMANMRQVRGQLTTIVSAIALAVVLTGCPIGRETTCSRGEHVVRSIEAPETGRTCVRNGQTPPKGYEEYPAGNVPTYMDEDD